MAAPRGAAGGSSSGHRLVNEEVDGEPLGGVFDRSDSSHHLFDEDIDGGPPRGCYWRVRQWVPPGGKKSMVDPLGGAVGGSGGGHHFSSK
jgi:hypothetical protein